MYFYVLNKYRGKLSAMESSFQARYKKIHVRHHEAKNLCGNVSTCPAVADYSSY